MLHPFSQSSSIYIYTTQGQCFAGYLRARGGAKWLRWKCDVDISPYKKESGQRRSVSSGSRSSNGRQREGRFLAVPYIIEYCIIIHKHKLTLDVF